MSLCRRVFTLVVLSGFLAAQIAAQARCDVCAKSGCHVEGGACCGAARTGSADAAGCPLCRAAAGADLVGAETQGIGEIPCRCMWEARENQPLSTSRGFPGTPDLAAQVAMLPALAVPTSGSGFSREFLAAALAVPKRPPRILYGIWRN